MPVVRGLRAGWWVAVVAAALAGCGETPGAGGDEDTGAAIVDAAGGSGDARLGVRDAGATSDDATLGSADGATASGADAAASADDATAGSADAAASGDDATAGGTDATAGGADATAGRVDATAGGADATAGRVDATAGRVDATAGGTDATAGRVDVGPISRDAAVADAAVADAARADATPAIDSGVRDSGVADSGFRDAAVPSCAAAPGGGQPHTSTPVLLRTFADRWHEAWLGSPAVADLDHDGVPEIIVPRDNRLLVWRPNGTIRWSVDVPGGGRIWASPIVADLVGGPDLEVVVASRANIAMYDASGAPIAPFPIAWRDEVRSIAAGDVDGDGRLEIVAVTSTPLAGGGLRDIIQVIRADGTVEPGFPPNTTGNSGCTTACYVTGGYDQNVAVGPIDGDDRWDILAAQDNAYLSWHRGDGTAFLANAIFPVNTVLGIRFLHDYALAQLGYAPNEATANQAHFTNTAPAIADIDGDGVNELVLVASVQNAAQTDRLRGVALWVLRSDGSRPAAWLTPFHVPAYLAGLWDFEGTNVVGATNQVSIADIDAASPGLEMVFAGFDGRIHAVGADRSDRWSFQYTTANNQLTGGVAIADLSGDGSPEIVFSSYSTASNTSALYVLAANGVLEHRIPLPDRGAMPVPTVADGDGDGTLDIVVSLKDAVDRVRSVLVYRVPGSAPNCLPWPTGRANLLRNGYVAP